MYIAIEFVNITSCQCEARFVNKKNVVMFSQISWATYFETVVYSIAIYYVFILYKYYRYDLASILKGKQRPSLAEGAFTPSPQQSTFSSVNTTNQADLMPKEDQGNRHSLLAQALTDEIQAFIAGAGNNKFEREPILLSLQLLVGKYPSVKVSPYKESIQELIAQQCATNCSVHLSEEELDGLWV